MTIPDTTMSARSHHAFRGDGRRWRASLASLVLAAFLLVTVLAAPAVAFVDVPVGHVYNEAVTSLAARGIVSGYNSEHFGPGDPLLRQQFAKLVVLMFDLPVAGDETCRFNDVTNISGLYPDKLIEAAAIAKIIQGKTAKTFDPRDAVTRAQVLTLVVRGADQLHPGLLEAPGPLYPSPWGRFDDGTHWKNAAKAMKNGLLVGIDLSGKGPNEPMPRGEVAQVLFNLLKRMENADLDAGTIIDVGGGTQKVLSFIHHCGRTRTAVVIWWSTRCRCYWATRRRRRRWPTGSSRPVALSTTTTTCATVEAGCTPTTPPRT